MLTIIDVFTREALTIEVGPKLRGEHVANALNRLVYLHGKPKMDLSRFDAAPLIAFIAAKETNHGTETDK